MISVGALSACGIPIQRPFSAENISQRNHVCGAGCQTDLTSLEVGSDPTITSLSRPGGPARDTTPQLCGSRPGAIASDNLPPPQTPPPAPRTATSAGCTSHAEIAAKAPQLAAAPAIRNTAQQRRDERNATSWPRCGEVGGGFTAAEAGSVVPRVRGG